MGRLTAARGRLEPAPLVVAPIQRDSARERGYGTRWERESGAFRVRHPLCLGCEAVGRTAATRITDHVIPHTHGSPRFWDQGCGSRRASGTTTWSNRRLSGGSTPARSAPTICGSTARSRSPRPARNGRKGRGRVKVWGPPALDLRSYHAEVFFRWQRISRAVWTSWATRSRRTGVSVAVRRKNSNKFTDLLALDWTNTRIARAIKIRARRRGSIICRAAPYRLALNRKA